jgi:hypothetical protein
MVRKCGDCRYFHWLSEEERWGKVEGWCTLWNIFVARDEEIAEECEDYTPLPKEVS